MPTTAKQQANLRRGAPPEVAFAAAARKRRGIKLEEQRLDQLARDDPRVALLLVLVTRLPRAAPKQRTSR